MLVIIGLVVGGVLVGQNLISAAQIRAQITQIEKYNSAVNTFKGKFNALPGDMRPEIATQYGFSVGTNCGSGAQGLRDGNGLLETAGTFTLGQTYGETGLFWQDITSSASGGLIEGQFPNGSGRAISCNLYGTYALANTQIGGYIPAAKLGNGNFVYVYSSSGSNWFGLSSVSGTDSNGVLQSSAKITVMQSYTIDAKIDDALPLSGNVVTYYIGAGALSLQSSPNTTTAGGTSSSCYDTTTGTYSVTVNNGRGGNCALSFKFQ